MALGKIVNMGLRAGILRVCLFYVRCWVPVLGSLLRAKDRTIELPVSATVDGLPVRRT